MLNQVNLIGRLGQNPDTKGNVVKFSLATTEKIKDKNGMSVDKTEWHNITLFGKVGEIAAQYVTKGQLVYVTGRLQTSKWDDKEGKTHQRTEIIGANLKMLSPKNNEGFESTKPNKEINYNLKGSHNGYAEDDDLDDLPF